MDIRAGDVIEKTKTRDNFKLTRLACQHAKSIGSCLTRHYKIYDLTYLAFPLGTGDLLVDISPLSVRFIPLVTLFIDTFNYKEFSLWN